jgi:hypothetical protein
VRCSKAVLMARQAAWSAHPGANTWGAYQCYGDPGYRLVRDEAEHRKAVSPDFLAPSELATEARNLAEATRMQSKEKNSDDAALQARLRERIDALLARIPEPARGQGKENWLARGDVCAAIGFAYGEGRMFAEAVEWLNKALAARVGDCPVRAAEQCANFDVRLAAQEWADLRAARGGQGQDDAASQARRAAIAERIEGALYELDVINTRAQTDERLELLGSACKRLAWVQTGKDRVEALLNMAAYYRRAFDFLLEEDAYAFNNWAVACLLLEHLDPAYSRGDWHPALAALRERQVVAARQVNADDPSFWGDSGLADLQVVELLMSGDAAARCAELARSAAAQYAAAFARGASLREVASIQEHLDFLVELTADPARPWPAAVREALAAIRRTM